MTKQIIVSLITAVFLWVATASAQWRVEIESKIVYPGQTAVSVDFILYTPQKIVQLGIPVVVRELEPGSFWTGWLPYDTTNADGNHYVNGVKWHSNVPQWATIILELRMGPGCENSGPYDGVSPDHFLIGIIGGNPYFQYPQGATLVTIRFDVTETLGQFEFDTACFTGSLNKIFMIDNTSIDRGPAPGTNEVVFNKGVITIAPCDCGVIWGDVTGDGAINPVDAVVMVNYVYKMLDQRIQPPNCPQQTGDMNCDGSVNPVDNIWFTQYVYNGRQVFSPCAPCTDYARR